MAAKLYEFQEQALASVKREFRTHKSVLLVSPTGSGKGTMVSHVAATTRRRTLVLAPREEIVMDLSARLHRDYGISAGIIAGAHRRNPDARVQVATIQAALRMEDKPEAELIIPDEAHHYLAREWRELINHYSDARILGATATPQRPDGTPLGDMFEAMVVATQYSFLMSKQLLMPCDLYRPAHYLGADLALAPLEAYRRHAKGPTIVFARSKRDVDAITSQFNAAGFHAVGITESTPRTVRRQAIEVDYPSGKVKVLVNFMVLTEGVDLAMTESVILCRGFDHVSQYLQTAGRAARPWTQSGKTSYRLLDLTGASYRFDFPDADREYSLEGTGIFEVREDRTLGYSPTVGHVLNLPLTFALRSSGPKVTAADRKSAWEDLVTQAKTGGITLLDARVEYQRRFGMLAPIFVR